MSNFMISRSRTGAPVFGSGMVFLGKAIKKVGSLLNPALVEIS